MSSQTPMMNQYKKIKNDHPDSILMFRLGDFYEMFFEDAKVASKILGIALTSRNKSKENPVPLCGVPFHSVEPYISKLLENGKKVAICEQVEDPKEAKGIVKRKVVKVLTPGVILDSENLESKNNNYLACVFNKKNTYGLSYTDISTGEFKTSLFDSYKDLISELSHLEPREILVCNDNENLFNERMFLGLNPLITSLDSWKWDLERCRNTLLQYLGVQTLESFGIELKQECVITCGVLLEYILETQMDFMPQIDSPKYYNVVDYLHIDESTKRNLELVRSNTTDSELHSLLWVLDKTKTAMGARLIRQWINYPLLDAEKIKNRQDGVEELIANQQNLQNLTDILKNISDIERLIARISTASAKPRDLASIRDSSDYITKLKDELLPFNSEGLTGLREAIDDFSDIRDFLNSSIVDNPPISVRDGGVVKEGYDPELDELREIQKDGKKWISDLEVNERKSTGINSLKIGYNKVFGYYIEVTKTNLSLVPEAYIRKQTLSNGERFITPELKEYEDKIFNAQERILKIENELFESIREKVSEQSHRIRHTAGLVAKIDVLCSLAVVAQRYDYIKPELSNYNEIIIKECRHPVIERIDLESSFIPNDIQLDHETNQFLIITGPNMAGKSTLIRQVALVVLMAQIGSFIPAKSAKIGVVDRIFTRVGASDNLTKGQSTFMVEMVETAYIIRNATDKSLVILDEIGRGTSTFDGMSIAWAVSEYLHDLGCLTLFATHYHELANLDKTKKKAKNYNVMVKQDKDEIIFLRKLIPGYTSHSYGIQVAKIAGIPNKVLNTSKNVLKSLETLQSKLSESISGEQFFLFENNDEDFEIIDEENELIKEIDELEPMNMTPLEALNKLVELKEKIKK
ncbi:MAG: DNA mismatch repair protein MutS [Candidatus Dadabacteria bacterium]|nr:DNA mismatch repair protein MutS [Candidatus Dadabacteria bacterium]NIQ14855.1 DNA mismatch repair protein MutS [Candidatus Dadabacteria bacterium]